MQKVVNLADVPGKEAVDIIKVSRAVVETLGAVLAVYGKELVSVQILCKDREKELIYAQEFGFEEKEADND